MDEHARAIHPFLDQDEQGEARLLIPPCDPSGLGNVELPMTVRDAARFLGVSTQTVYLWVERKRIPHLRVMGRNIRFLKSELQPFRAQFRQEVENATTE
jgi:excisionase family DNA binding protein